MTPQEPAIKRAIAFVDGQNLFYAAKKAFGCHFPNYDPKKLAQEICHRQGWQLERVQFYTGIPAREDDEAKHAFWTNKLLQMSRDGVRTYKRPLRYRNKTIQLDNGNAHTLMVGQEKGIDVRIALDIIAATYRQETDVLLVFSQDQDLSEVADEIRLIAQGQQRWIKIASAFPSSPTSSNRRGIEKTDWIKIDRTLYEACVDQRDYRR